MNSSSLKKNSSLDAVNCHNKLWLWTNPILSTQARVSVLTCGTGNESYSLLDIRPSDQRSSQFIDLVYNYGAFDFNTPNFVAKFTKETSSILLLPILTLTS
jgi:hypothetical protein